MIKKLTLMALIIWSVLVTYLYFTTPEKTSTNKKQMEICVNAIDTSNKLLNNCSEAYTTFGDCVSSTNCDVETTQQKLSDLNTQKIELEKEIQELTKQLLKNTPK
ncbi:hypothetical protein CO058_00585 [candidate division WWE3 bacterium CG_4_9_14_0_2_um_filter_35_11]|uniref:Uncharacterized protein n=1 Tax=candidate division WWE3 bacterium CG_4_9_14_0_2_um_filter_35_11 TaxID=1975077 RepID=A0A2M8EMK5_UNCKA|nr:MAG: hypothetical protein COV25_01400 [candidate division WWE3 bacterium CG10_big_fil_rev_8_21_14_0_10_35_32]PJC23973.1 MAG: hypothetical protein CO058_00585 [candidate division WWE3 bacterium CG_4_9_14_0_2_um_filter_35_11]